MYRGLVLVRSASSAARAGPAASARYRPRWWPVTTLPAAKVAPRSATNRPRNSCSSSMSTAMMSLLCSGVRGSGRDGGFGDAAPLGPGTVVNPDPVAADQVGEYEPSSGSSSADGAVRDQLAVVLRDGRLEHVAQFLHGAERPVLVVDAVDGLVDGRRHVPCAAAWFQAARWPEALSLVLSG